MNQKLVKKLAEKKYRTESGLFLVEGQKCIIELLSSDFSVETIFGTDAFLDTLDIDKRTKNSSGYRNAKIIRVTEETLEKIGTLQTNNAGIAVARMRQPSKDLNELTEYAKKGIVLALDDVRDPGNFGTIIRIADWYGVEHIVVTPNTTDFYNPKTISASMGSFTRIQVHYIELEQFLSKASLAKVPVVGAFMDGNDLHKTKLAAHGVLLMGSESHGISGSLAEYVSERITIPKWGKAESLNVSIATGIILDAIRRG